MSTTTSVAASPTCAASLYDIPVQDAACAIAYGGNHTDIMSNCCKSADVVSYYGNCGLYCLAEGQNVKELTDCLHEQGAGWGDVFCRGNETATATATGAALPTSADASVAASGAGGSKTGDKTSSGASSTSSSTGNAAPRTSPDFNVSTLGLTIGALLFSATALGAFSL
ncbi:hypothetical protein JX265_008495 [Neoarthrinium moseri]|uniref:Uncharacterized protein n=1 Tax=Neoarthrinium moseri TaxID=1658444 RepID=A0A9P9WI64_9PEZI|nr:uncharacterized protein JN550_001498 [Neoarthrinium moseri]KAI1843678.1 hypothetical protein JX266_010124 [Neoarthrinium moseri]KAI1864771.1 hypothetical protein JX265_008495 [Neoarthrinium moseri]KAI1876002.1 hypothetical protein JN550_001498 [Neoarthrinium moseri]